MGRHVLSDEAPRGTRRAARVGSAGRAAFHLLLGVVAVRLALGAQGEQGGALGTLVDAPWGRALVAALAAALLAYGVFRALRALHPDPDDPRAMPSLARRTVDAARSGFHVGLAGLAAVTAWQGGSSSGRGLTAAVLASTAGRAAVVGAGVAVVVGAVTIARQGLVGHAGPVMADRTDGSPALERVRTAGFLGRAVAYVATGVFLAHAGLTRDPDAAGGIDAALQEVQRAPWGTWVLLVVGAGYLASAAYLTVLAREHAG